MPTINPETDYATDYEFYDNVRDATFTPGDAHGDDATTHTVKVRWIDAERQPQYGVGRLPMSPDETLLAFWKGEATAAPDPQVDEAITVDSVAYRISRVVSYRNGQWQLAVNEGV